jgi:hypothetical protein
MYAPTLQAQPTVHIEEEVGIQAPMFKKQKRNKRKNLVMLSKAEEQ